MSPRLVKTKIDTSIAGILDVHTIIYDERSFRSTWARPNVPLLIFADHTLPAPSVTFQGGPIGTGLPVQLIFWGSWWNSVDGVGQQTLIIERTRALIDSNYFSELTQYGVSRPTWRGAIVVTRPDPPLVFNNTEDSYTAVSGLIDDLLDDDVFPDPDDGRIAFVVLMPKGFTQNIGASGAHSSDFDYDFPFDEDNYWFAWVRYFDPVEIENTIVTVSHELAEMFTDPEPPSGWWAVPAEEQGEISDAAVSGRMHQTAWVNGAKVQAYWSNRHSATVIPIDQDYSAQIKGKTAEISRRVLDTGTFRPDPADGAACGRVPECCIEDRDYIWTLVGFDESATLRLSTSRFRQPKGIWAIEGITVQGTGTIQLTVMAETFRGQTNSQSQSTVDIVYTAHDDILEIRSLHTKANFDIRVSCRITDASITGNVKINVVAELTIVVGFVGVQLVLDPDYLRQRSACLGALIAQYNQHYDRLNKIPGPGDPINYDVLARLPAYVRINQYREAQNSLVLMQMAKELLPPEDSQAFTSSLIKHLPVLSLFSPSKM